MTENLPRDTFIQAKALVQTLVNPNRQVEQLKEQASRLLSSEHLMRVIRRMTLQDQEKLIKRVNQVMSFRSSGILSCNFFMLRSPGVCNRWTAR